MRKTSKDMRTKTVYCDKPGCSARVEFTDSKMFDMGKAWVHVKAWVMGESSAVECELDLCPEHASVLHIPDRIVPGQPITPGDPSTAKIYPSDPRPLGPGDTVHIHATHGQWRIDQIVASKRLATVTCIAIAPGTEVSWKGEQRIVPLDELSRCHH
jgi:hypothetical protein